MDNVISVIVPVYNVEKYLDECVASLISQTYKNLEIILVDDGSTDNSGMICDSWGLKDNRIKVFHKENSGVSSARNLGLDNSTGTYVAFVDSDDTIDETAYETAVKYTTEQNLDLLAFGMKRVWRDHTDVNTLDFDLYTLADWQKNGVLFLTSTVGVAAVWGKLYRSEIIKQNNLSFEVGSSIDEDNRFNLRYLEHADRVKCLPQPFYNYRYLEQGLSSKARLDYYKKTKEKNRLTMEFAGKKNIEDIREKAVEKSLPEFMFFSLMFILRPGKEFSLKQRKTALKELYTCGRDNEVLIRYLKKRSGVSAKMLYAFYTLHMSTLMILSIHVFTWLKKGKSNG